MKISRTKPYIHHGLVVTAMTAWSLLLIIDILSITIIKINMPLIMTIIAIINGYFLYGIIGAYFFTITLGYPFWKIAKHYNLDTRRNIAIFGAFTGFLAGGVNFYFMITIMQSEAIAFHFLDLVLTVFVGGFAASVGHKKAYKYVSEPN